MSFFCLPGVLNRLDCRSFLLFSLLSLYNSHSYQSSRVLPVIITHHLHCLHSIKQLLPTVFVHTSQTHRPSYHQPQPTHHASPRLRNTSTSHHPPQCHRTHTMARPQRPPTPLAPPHPQPVRLSTNLVCIGDMTLTPSQHTPRPSTRNQPTRRARNATAANLLSSTMAAGRRTTPTRRVVRRVGAITRKSHTR